MHKDGQKILNLMFLPGETVSVTPDSAGYHSVPLENALSGEVKLLLPSFKDENDFKTVSTDALLSVALNPIDGWCRDANATAYRNFLVELDIGTQEEQINYIKNSKIPYSAMVFSGGKSVHTLIALDNGHSTEKSYRKTIQWILNILPLADANCKNPSRKIRIPGAERSPGKFQKLLEFKGKVKDTELAEWLAKHQSSCPKERVKRPPAKDADIANLKPMYAKMLKNGFPAGMGRNQGWFQIACELYSIGMDEDGTIDFLQQYYQEDHDFREKEWLTSIRSAFKHKMENSS